MSLLAKLQHIASETEDVPRPTVTIADAIKYGPAAYSRETVLPSEDLTRIQSLPRRPRPEHVDRVRADLSLGGQTLRHHQAWALEEAPKANGLLAPLGTGSGKTHLAFLLPMVMPECRYAVLLIPPNLREHYNRQYEEISKHWKLPNLAGGRYFTKGRPTLRIIAYSELSSPKATDLLRQIAPDLIICDEAHNLKARNSARTKRFLRYFADAQTTRLCVMSGTLTTRSLKDYAHLSALALRERSPLPLHWPTVEEWSGALDAVELPSHPGALKHLCEPGEDVRSGFRRRLVETEGVVSTEESAFMDASLVLSTRPLSVPGEVAKALEHVRKTESRPDGEELVDALSIAKCKREIASGFYFRWRYPRGEPPEVIDNWFEKRQAWNKELRDKLKVSREHLDSPMLCMRAAERHYAKYQGPLPTWKSLAFPAWKQVHKDVVPVTQAVWVDEFLVSDAVAWAKKNVGILWVENPEVGERIAQRAGIPWFGGGDDASREILDEDGSRSIVASIKAHGTGKNLVQFSRNLVVQCPSSGAVWEQLIARTHRPGQQADEVTVEMYQHTPEVQSAFEQAKRDAVYIQQSSGMQQKLLVATYA